MVIVMFLSDSDHSNIMEGSLDELLNEYIEIRKKLEECKKLTQRKKEIEAVLRTEFGSGEHEYKNFHIDIKKVEQKRVVPAKVREFIKQNFPEDKYDEIYDKVTDILEYYKYNVVKVEELHTI